jgi:hypothetical protein
VGDRRRRSLTRITMASAAIETGLSHVVQTEAPASWSRVISGFTTRANRDAGDNGEQPVERGPPTVRTKKLTARLP